MSYNNWLSAYYVSKFINTSRNSSNKPIPLAVGSSIMIRQLGEFSSIKYFKLGPSLLYVTNLSFHFILMGIMMVVVYVMSINLNEYSIPITYKLTVMLQRRTEPSDGRL